MSHTKSVHIFQVCGIKVTDNFFTSNNWSLCGYLYCDIPFGTRSSFIDALQKKELCRNSCQNLDKDQYDNIQCHEEIQTGPDSLSLQESESCSYAEDSHIKMCDDVCDCWNCQDESQCNGYVYGKICTTVPSLIIEPPPEICNNISTCTSSKHLWTDEGGCDHIPPGMPSCVSGELMRRKSIKKVIPLFNYTRCSTIEWSRDMAWYGAEQSNVKRTGTPYCWDYIDQTNCTDVNKVGVRCFIAGYGYSTISKVMVCGKYKRRFCVDKMDVACVKVDKACTIHKHQLCDGLKDCSSGADESHPSCLIMTEKTCFRNYRTTRKLPIPADWLRDNLADCMNGVDEDWEIECGQGVTRRVEVSSLCEDVFLCSYGRTKFVRLSQLCSGIDKCSDENSICEIGRGLTGISTVISHQTKNIKFLQHCLRGLENTEYQISPCISQEFNPLAEQVFGLTRRTMVTHQNQTVDCRFTYGEPYVYLSCLGMCENSECPLTKHVDYRDCPLQFNKRIYTVVNRSKLTFVTRRFDQYHNNYFVCANGLMCIDYDKVCNLWDDCGDGSDEKNCSNNFICKDKQGILPLSKKCDRNADCGDISDECNSECSKHIINKPFLKGAAWVIGLLAVLSNACILYENISNIKVCHSGQTLANRLLVILIAVGDFLIGAYLFIIAIADSFFYGKDYCIQQFQWLTSFYCSSLGIMSTFGSLVSLFSLTILSIIRAAKLYRGDLNHHHQKKSINRREYFSLSILISLIVLFAATIACLSLLDKLEDFFVNGLVYDKSIKIFHGQIEKDRHFKVIQSYYGRSKDGTLSWKQIQSLVASMFSDDYGNLDGKISRVDFYGNDGVCLFKFFVTPNDPQMAFSIVILVISIVCFVIVSGAYIAINVITYKSSRTLLTCGGPTASVVRKRNQRLQKKIATIIVTDFLCWIPFILVCFLHYFGVLDATAQYGLFSIIILPINSVINPFLYSEVMSDVMNKIWAKLRTLSDFDCQRVTAGDMNITRNRNMTRNLQQAGESSVLKARDIVEIPMVTLRGNEESIKTTFLEISESRNAEDEFLSNVQDMAMNHPRADVSTTDATRDVKIPTIIITQEPEKTIKSTVCKEDEDEKSCEAENVEDLDVKENSTTARVCKGSTLETPKFPEKEKQGLEEISRKAI